MRVMFHLNVFENYFYSSNANNFILFYEYKYSSYTLFFIYYWIANVLGLVSLEFIIVTHNYDFI